MTLDEFMATYCGVPVTKTSVLRTRRTALLGAGRNGEVELPPPAEPHVRGGKYRFFSDDLAEAWPGFLATGV